VNGEDASMPYRSMRSSSRATGCGPFPSRDKN
jgi:hypothetical protein